MIRIEFWNGMYSKKTKYKKYNGLVPTNHNPCLWSNNLNGKPWRGVYKKALEYINDWKNKKINDTDFLHALRYVAYGYNDIGDDKRYYDDSEVIWPGNLTINHKPRLVVQNDTEIFSIDFYFDNEFSLNSLSTDNYWKTNVINDIDFYWDL
jgi:hypothetical protein